MIGGVKMDNVGKPWSIIDAKVKGLINLMDITTYEGKWNPMLRTRVRNGLQSEVTSRVWTRAAMHAQGKVKREFNG